MDMASGIGRNVQKHEGIPAGALIEDPQQAVDALHPRILAFPPEPSRTDGNVSFGRDPFRSMDISPLESVCGRRARSRREPFGIQSAPGSPSVASGFVPAPTATGAHIGKHDGIRLEGSHRLVEERPVVDLLLAARTFSVRPVEPLLVHFTI